MAEALTAATQFARRDLLTGGACFAGAALAGSVTSWSVPHSLPAGGLKALIPLRLGDWNYVSSYDIVDAEENSSNRGPYDDLLTRIYASDLFPSVTLLVAYVGSQRGDVQLHRPEACYPAAGFILSDRRPVRLSLAGGPTISAQMILAESPMRSEQLLYWTRVGADFPRSAVGQIGSFVRANLMGIVPDAILVRLSVPGTDRTRAWATVRAFLAALREESSPGTVELLFGK